MDVKTCFKCNQEKPLKDFYKHKAMADGHVNKCKECNKKDVSKSRAARLDYYQEYDRKRANQPHRIAKRKEIAEKWKNNPELRKITNKRGAEWRQANKIKRAAHVLTGNAMATGKLIKQPCEICEKKRVEAHHDDYTKPLDVRWLCKKHHAEHHKNEREILRNK
jgi:hypothetical protein